MVTLSRTPRCQYFGQRHSPEMPAWLAADALSLPHMLIFRRSPPKHSSPFGIATPRSRHVRAAKSIGARPTPLIGQLLGNGRVTDRLHPGSERERPQHDLRPFRRTRPPLLESRQPRLSPSRPTSPLPHRRIPRTQAEHGEPNARRWQRLLR